MKLYYKIWVYDNCGTAAVENTDYSISVSEKENVIVLTIEELRDAYNAGGAHRCAMQEGDYSHSFDNYLKTQGITIP